MTPIDRLKKVNDKLLAMSAYKALCGKDEDSKKLDGVIQEINSVIKTMKKGNNV